MCGRLVELNDPISDARAADSEDVSERAPEHDPDPEDGEEDELAPRPPSSHADGMLLPRARWREDIEKQACFGRRERGAAGEADHAANASGFDRRVSQGRAPVAVRPCLRDERFTPRPEELRRDEELNEATGERPAGKIFQAHLKGHRTGDGPWRALLLCRGGCGVERDGGDEESDHDDDPHALHACTSIRSGVMCVGVM